MIACQLCNAERINQQIVLIQDNAFWRTRGAAGVNQQGFIIKRGRLIAVCSHRRVRRFGNRFIIEKCRRAICQRLMEAQLVAVGHASDLHNFLYIWRAFAATSATDYAFRAFKIFRKQQNRLSPRYGAR